MVSPATAQTETTEKTFDDRSFKEAILEETREFYGKETARAFLLTDDDVLGVNSSDTTELEGSLVESILTAELRPPPFATTIATRPYL